MYLFAHILDGILEMDTQKKLSLDIYEATDIIWW